ncbi:MAG: YggS family pyridoxal phosphate-dependent enzyme [Dehalococcoidia bacterium]|nr:YggS family pyridoxal phosphate-dependent enzyme [Dehalococcoidia bacterium]
MLTYPDVATGIEEVRRELAAACERVGRDPAEVEVVAVSKTHPVEAIEAALAAGVADFGENRVQEFVPKAREAEERGLTPRWHFVGHLQRNKVREAVHHIDVLHSVDSVELLTEIERRLAIPTDAGAPPALPCYLEVNIAREAQKHGVAPELLSELLTYAEACKQVTVAGLMTMAPQGASPDEARAVFRGLRELAGTHGIKGLSMGMTDDYAVAVEEGATVVRIGRAIFGDRRT